MKSSDLFLRCLEAEGVEMIFGVPGEENADLMISLLDSPIKFVITRHEQGAAFMADIYGRLTGRPGVCLSTLGPGATNLATGFANAHFDRSPVVAITGQGSQQRLHKESHQNMDAVSMFGPISKWSTTIRRPDSIPEVVRKAFKLAKVEKPGGVHIELPEDVAKEDCDLPPLSNNAFPLRRAAPDSKAVRRAAEMIQAAHRPVILAGNGCARKRATAELAKFIDKTGIMVAQTFMGKGVLSARDHRSLLCAGLGSRDHVSEAFDLADLIVTVGYDMIEWDPSRWNSTRDKKIVHIDFEPAETDAHYQTEVEVVADIAGSLAAITEALPSDLDFDLAPFTHLREHMLCEIGFEELSSCHHGDIDVEAAKLPWSDAMPMTPPRILRDLRSLMNDDDIVISDVGAHKMWAARHYPVFEPHTCIISNGFCSMGIALPGAIAAKMVRPEVKVVGLCGDGGFLMNVQDLATAVQYKVPAVYLVWEDGGYGLIRWKQENQFGVHSHTEFSNPDLVALGRSFGAFAIKVETAEHFKTAMEESFAQADRPSVVVVPVDYSQNRRLTERLGRLIAH